jgi:1-acyl-sn-glycerol-3-phosphate acyltransferase
VIVISHRSQLDSIFVAKAKLERNLALRGYACRLGIISIDHSVPAQHLEEVEQIKRDLARDNSVVILPEGTFTHLIGLQPFHLAHSRSQWRAGVPITPIALNGMRSAGGQEMDGTSAVAIKMESRSRTTQACG